MYTHAHDFTSSSPPKFVRFNIDDQLIMYDEDIPDSPSPMSTQSPLPTPSPPSSTPSPTTDTTDNSSEGPLTPPTPRTQDLGDRVLMSQELVDLQVRGWTLGQDQIAPQWDKISATGNRVNRIHLSIEGLPIRIVVDPPPNLEWISIGHLYRAIESSLLETVSTNDPNSDLNLLDFEKRESVLEHFLRRRNHSGKAQMQKFDFLLGRHVLAEIIPNAHGSQLESWQLVFREEEERDSA